MNVITKDMVRRLKSKGEDFEWYPTTDEIIRKVAAHIRGVNYNFRYDDGTASILDRGIERLDVK